MVHKDDVISINSIWLCSAVNISLHGTCNRVYCAFNAPIIFFQVYAHLLRVHFYVLEVKIHTEKAMKNNIYICIADTRLYYR